VINKDFTYSCGGWRIGHNPRTLADLNGDGTADIIAFRTNGEVWVALNNGGTCREPKLSINEFDSAAGTNKHPLFVADINGDGLGDIVWFGDKGVYVAIGNGDGTFQHPKLVLNSFGYIGGWRVDKHPRYVVDLTGDGAVDIIVFGNDAV
jgi:hypothetical protein